LKSKIFGILTCLTLITLSATFTMADLLEGLVAYWPLNEGKGVTAADLSGNGNPGTLDLPVWDKEGKFGSALNFDGVDDRVDCGNPEILDFGTSDFTISVWIKTTASAEISIFAKGGDDGGGIRYWMGMIGTSIQLVFDDNVTKYNPLGTIVVNDDQWHHIVAMRRDGTLLRVYVDGVEDPGITNDADSTIPAEYDISGTSQRNALIGAIWSEGNNVVQKFFGGLIDDVAVWNRALTENEIVELAADSIQAAVEPNGKLTITWGSIKN